MSFIVTEKAMRPASSERRCFYCQQPIGAEHKPKCGLILKKAKVRLIVEYEIDVPAHWDQDNVEFHRNHSSWCGDNGVDELVRLVEATNEAGDCLCGIMKYEFVAFAGEPFMGEG